MTTASAQGISYGIRYTVTDLRNAAQSAIRYSMVCHCGAQMGKGRDGDKAWTLETRPGLAVRVSGHCKGKARHPMTATEAL